MSEARRLRQFLGYSSLGASIGAMRAVFRHLLSARHMRFKISRWPGYRLAFVFVFFFALSLRQLMDNDVWFQLLAGQETVRTLAVPRTEFYIYSALGEPSLFVGWLWGLWLYLAWLAGGYTAVSIFGALVWGAIFAIGAKAIVTNIERNLPGGETYSRKAVLAAVLVATSVSFQFLVGRAVLRAEATMYLAWVVAVYLSAGIAEDERRQRRFLFVVPLLSWSLGWLHTTSIFMVLLLVGHLLQAGVDAMRAPLAGGFRKFAKTDLWTWLLAILAAAALPCLNPNGVEQALPLIADLTRSLHGIMLDEHADVAGRVMHINLEYRRLLDVPLVWSTAILFLVFSLVVVWLDRPRRVINAVLLAVGLSLSLMYIRALAIWGVFLMVPLAVAIAPFLQKATAVLESKGKGTLIVGFIGMCCVWNIGAVYNRAGARWGIGYRPSPASEQVLNAIRANMPNGGNIFNSHPLGARLRWNLGPGFFVAMDGHLADARSSAWNAYYDIEDSGDTGPRLIEKWNVRAVYHPVVTPAFAQIHWLPYYLVNDQNWSLVAMDQNGVLLTRISAGSVDERARNGQKMDYWRRVVIEAKVVEFTSGQEDSKDRARRIVDYAQERIGELQNLFQSENAKMPR